MLKQSPFACVMDAIETEKRVPHLANARRLFNSVEEIRELESGYAFRFCNETEILTSLADFIALERLCCPFFGFNVDVESEGGAIWFSVTGRAGVKPFIQAEIGEIVGRPTLIVDFRFQISD